MNDLLKLIIVSLAGVAIAAPAIGRSRPTEPECPAMPTTNDVERAREGGASLQIAGFGISGNKSRARSTKDVMMREGGFEAWSAAVVMAQACHNFRKQYPRDYQRQTQEMQKLREKLLSPLPSNPSRLARAVAEIDMPAPSDQKTSNGFENAFAAKPNESTAKVTEGAKPAGVSAAPMRSYATPTTSTTCAGNACIQTTYCVESNCASAHQQYGQSAPPSLAATCLPMIIGQGGAVVTPSFCINGSGGMLTMTSSNSGQTTIFGY